MLSERDTEPLDPSSIREPASLVLSEAVLGGVGCAADVQALANLPLVLSCECANAADCVVKRNHIQPKRVLHGNLRAMKSRPLYTRSPMTPPSDSAPIRIKWAVKTH
jgi:hypothetical protein